VGEKRGEVTSSSPCCKSTLGMVFFYLARSKRCAQNRVVGNKEKEGTPSRKPNRGGTSFEKHVQKMVSITISEKNALKRGEKGEEGALSSHGGPWGGGSKLMGMKRKQVLGKKVRGSEN